MGKIGRNAPCPCGSGKKYKKCCFSKDKEDKLAKEHFEDKFYEDEFDDDLLEEKGLDEYEDGEDDEDEEFFEEEHSLEDRPSKKIDHEIPEITDEENRIVNAWWDKYMELEKIEDIRGHLEDFFTRHPKLVPNLEIEEVLFELSSQYLKRQEPDRYIDLLLQIRKEFPESYLKAFGFYDRDIICYNVITNQKDRIPEFLNYFKEYPDEDPDNLFHVVDYLMVNNCQDIVKDFVRDIYYDIATSSEIIHGDEILGPLVVSHLIPFLKPDFSDQDMERLSGNLKKIRVPINKDYYRPDFLKEQFDLIFGDFSNWDISDCKTNEEIRSRYWTISQNFMRFLYERKDKDWMAAEFFRSRVYDYLVCSIPEGKRPKEAFIFSKDLISKTLSKIYRKIVSLDTTRVCGALSGLYYFAEYLEATDSISEERKGQIQKWCFELHHETFPAMAEIELSARVFEKFPF